MAAKVIAAKKPALKSERFFTIIIKTAEALNSAAGG